MYVEVLKPFGYARDAGGLNADELAAGHKFECRDDLAPGLVCEGWVREIPRPAPPVPPAGDDDAADDDPGADTAGPRVVKRDDGKFDVVAADGAVLNAEPLTRKAATALAADPPPAVN